MAITEKQLLVEGWRGVNHSYALINQHQILEMTRITGLELFHHDLPFAFPHWNAEHNDAGFDSTERHKIDALIAPRPNLDRVDGVYRICSPFRTGLKEPYSDHRTTTFMITELGLSPESFAHSDDRSPFFTRDENIIVTSTQWSRHRIIEYGFDPERVQTAPLGVDAGIFHQLWPDARARYRKALGIEEDETLFLNIGPPLWNKGIDMLLKAFTMLRIQGLKVRLIIKDQHDIYGIGLNEVIQNVGASFPPILQQSVLSGITTISTNLAPQQLASLFGSADCYVSPYRAEGFNLPVLEAISCSIPTIVTRGGATDDFCCDETSLRIPGRFHRKNSDSGLIGAYVEPELDALYEAMAKISRGWRPDRVRFDVARRAVLERFTWSQAAKETVRMTLN